MEVSRRDFVRASTAVAGGGALADLAGLGTNLAPTLARAAELRIKAAKPIRAGSDIAFLGGLIRFVINHDRWNTDGFLRDFVVNCSSRRC